MGAVLGKSFKHWHIMLAKAGAFAYSEQDSVVFMLVVFLNCYCVGEEAEDAP